MWSVDSYCEDCDLALLGGQPDKSKPNESS